MKLAKWAQVVKERDGFRCVDCGSSESIAAHHVIPRALGGKNTLDNGKTLCGDCHNDVHTGDLSAVALAKKNGYTPKRSGNKRMTVYVDGHLARCVADDAKESYRSLSGQVQSILDWWYS